MQPRQRSKCCVTVAFSAIVPSRRASMRWMRPRGESISSRQSTYVGHVGRQKPQWTQSDVYSRITRRALPAGRAAPDRGEQARSVEGCPARTWPGSGTYATPEAGLTTASASASSVVASSPGANRIVARALQPDARATPPRPRASVSSPPTSARAAASCAATARSDPSKSSATRPGWRTSSALGCSCEPRMRAATPATSSASTTSVRSPSAAGGAGS